MKLCIATISLTLWPQKPCDDCQNIDRTNKAIADNLASLLRANKSPAKQWKYWLTLVICLPNNNRHDGCSEESANLYHAKQIKRWQRHLTRAKYHHEQQRYTWLSASTINSDWSRCNFLPQKLM